MRKGIAALAVLTALLVVSCSDNGDNPVGPGNTTVAVSVDDVSVTEGAVAVFTISLSKAADSAVVFQYATANGTAGAPGDFTAAGVTIDTIAVGQTSINVNVTTIDDTTAESAETFTLVLSNLTGATFADSVGVATLTDNDGAAGVSYANEIQPILSARCAVPGCHGAGSSSGGYTMGAGAPYATVRNASGNNGPIIVASNSGASNLYLKTTSSSPFGSRMPLGGTPLSTADQQKIRDWIDQGAQDN